MLRVQFSQIKVNNEKALRLQKRMDRIHTRIIKQHDMMIKHLDEYHKVLVEDIKKGIKKTDDGKI